MSFASLCASLFHSVTLHRDEAAKARADLAAFPKSRPRARRDLVGDVAQAAGDPGRNPPPATSGWRAGSSAYAASKAARDQDQLGCQSRRREPLRFEGAQRISWPPRRAGRQERRSSAPLFEPRALRCPRCQGLKRACWCDDHERARGFVPTSTVLRAVCHGCTSKSYHRDADRRGSPARGRGMARWNPGRTPWRRVRSALVARAGAVADEGCACAPLQHRVDGGDAAAHALQRRRPRSGRDPGVGVQRAAGRFPILGAEPGRYMPAAMAKQGSGRLRCHRGGHPRQIVEAGV